MEWLEVVKHPLAFSAYSMSLLYSFALGRTNRKKYPWAAPALVVLLVVSIVGGMVLYGINVSAPKPPPQASAPTAPAGSKTSSTSAIVTVGTASPVIGSADGGLTITVSNGGGGGSLALVVAVVVFILVASLVAGVALLVVLTAKARKAANEAARNEG